MIVALFCFARTPFITVKPSLIDIHLAGASKANVQIVVHNPTRATIQFWLAGVWPNHNFQLKDANGTDVKRTAFGNQVLDMFQHPERGRDKNVPIKTAPGGSYKESLAVATLARLFELKSGSYTLIVTYRDVSFGKPLLMTSSSVKVAVSKETKRLPK